MLSDEWLPRYRLLENITAKWNGNGNGNGYDRGDYNSSFALRAVELKMVRANVWVSQTNLFYSNHNIDPSTMVIRHLKICVAFADKYIYKFTINKKRYDTQCHIN